MKDTRTTNFTLIELLAATFVLSMLVLGLLQIFSVTQKLSSASASRLEMCSRARMALDMIATDIMCLYYKEDVATLAISTENGLSIATQRSSPVPNIINDKISNTFCASKNTAVNYALANSETHFHTLRVVAVGSDDPAPNSASAQSDTELEEQYCKINKVYPDGKKIATFDKLEGIGAGSEARCDVIDGVASFKIFFMRINPNTGSLEDWGLDYDYDQALAHNANAGVTLSGGKSVPRVPDAVRIELELYDKDVMEAARNEKRGLNTGIDIDAMKNSSVHKQKFVRIVSIDRGQRNIATQGED